MRPSGIDQKAKVVIVLKPDTRLGLSKGKQQIERYIEAANQAYGGSCTGAIDLYDLKTGEVSRRIPWPP